MAALRAPVAPKQKEGVVRRQCRQIAPLAAVLAAAEAVVVSAGRRRDAAAGYGRSAGDHRRQCCGAGVAQSDSGKPPRATQSRTQLLSGVVQVRAVQHRTAGSRRLRPRRPYEAPAARGPAGRQLQPRQVCEQLRCGLVCHIHVYLVCHTMSVPCLPHPCACPPPPTTLHPPLSPHYHPLHPPTAVGRSWSC